MIEKFGKELDKTFVAHIKTISKIMNLTDEIGTQLTNFSDRNHFYKTSLNFARICIETPEAIITLVRYGFLSHTCLLLRWFIESSHLLLYLWDNKCKYQEWLSGKQIRAQEIGKYFATRGLPTWEKDYEEWCNIVHCNNGFIKCYHINAITTIANNVHKVEIGNIILNAAYIALEMNKFLITILASELPDEKMGYFEKLLTEIAIELTTLREEQQAAEKRLMNK